jgi:hypothetical protein
MQRSSNGGLTTRLKTALSGFLLAAAASDACAATANLIIFDDAVENGSDCSSTGDLPGYPIRIPFTTTFHTGTASIGIQDHVGVAFGWCPTAAYSIASDYDGISFWVNGGTQGGENVVLALANSSSTVVSATLAALYGAPLPINTWVHIQSSFFSPVFSYPDAAVTFNSIAFYVYSTAGSGNDFFFLDDIALIGVDIFKNGFE